MVNENDAFHLGRLIERLWVYARKQSPTDTDLGFIHREDIFEASYIDDISNIDPMKRRSEVRGFFVKEILPIIQIIQVQVSFSLSFLNNCLHCFEF